MNYPATALSVIHNVLQNLVDQLRLHAEVKLNPGVWMDKTLLQIVEALPLSKSNLKEDLSMNDLIKADQHLSTLKDVRIVYLPSSPVASIHVIGKSPEYETGMELQKFMMDTKLTQLKPDLRHYGFNHPNGVQPDGSDHGYERWVTIPYDLEVREPFVKKHFTGGLHAAHMIPMGSFEEWGWLTEWVEHHEEYEPN